MRLTGTLVGIRAAGFAGLAGIALAVATGGVFSPQAAQAAPDPGQIACLRGYLQTNDIAQLVACLAGSGSGLSAIPVGAGTNVNASANANGTPASNQGFSDLSTLGLPALPGGAGSILDLLGGLDPGTLINGAGLPAGDPLNNLLGGINLTANSSGTGGGSSLLSATGTANGNSGGGNPLLSVTGAANNPDSGPLVTAEGSTSGGGGSSSGLDVSGVVNGLTGGGESAIGGASASSGGQQAAEGSVGGGGISISALGLTLP